MAASDTPHAHSRRQPVPYRHRSVTVHLESLSAIRQGNYASTVTKVQRNLRGSRSRPRLNSDPLAADQK